METQKQMGIIPEKLRDKAIKFVLLKEKEKIPFQNSWQTKIIKYNDWELIEHLKKGGNYGVMGGGSKNLIILDFDNQELQDKLINDLPETFTVKTGSGLYHLYFFSDKSESFKIFNEEMETLADVQGNGKQVVAPNSIHPNGNIYEIIKNVPINYIDYSELKAKLMPYNQKKKKEIKNNSNFKKKESIEDNFLDLCKNYIKIDDVLKLAGVDTSKNPTECPFHSSKGGKCLGFQEEVAHCFHCEESWNIFSFISQWKNCDFKTTLEFLADNFNLREELEKSRKKYVEEKKEEIHGKVELRISSYFDKSDLAKQLWEIQPYFYDNAKLWWLWDNIQKRWKEVDETDILNMVSAKSFANTVVSKDRVEIVEAMRQYGRKKKPKTPKKTWIQFKETIFDIEKETSFKATPEYFICNPIPWDIGESEETPEIDKLFKEWVGKDYVKTLKQICVYCMLPDYPIHRLFCLIGEGSNGKSKFLEFVVKLVGQENITSTELEDLIGVRFEKAKLYTKSVCIMGETNFSNLRKTSLIKKLTGQDPIGGEKKNKNPFDFINYAKLLISTNGLPYTEDKSDGFFRRWCIINFPNKFKEQNNILSRIPEYEYNNFCRAAISLLKELLENMEFNEEGSVEERKIKYNEFSNPVSKFIESECIVGEGYKIPFFKFFEELTFFIKNNGYRELSKVEVSKILDREGYSIKTQRFEKDQNKSSSWKMIMGIELNYGGTERYLVEKDFAHLALPEELKSKNVGDIILYRRENKETIQILEKEGYLKYLGK